MIIIRTLAVDKDFLAEIRKESLCICAVDGAVEVEVKVGRIAGFAVYDADFAE